ncbi:MAG: globin [Corynebacterium sp.]|uniref:globin n=1 Tax=unclassified Corynebacterium TaxID=2624378 RepID=UPI002647990B|nr:globin [Corynebacterium sp.]MDN5719240.1 globin [Corynebacterium sp.]MDN6258759.1 globin [Corynebacterium sp.]MDN6325865.1 globin [Corynebacterium sp.]MDN6510750.1 globin [Corynebacterium sp.]
MTQPSSFYEAVGGEEIFRRIVHEFYRQIPDDDILGPMYPADDLAGAEDRLRWFLVQYWGGPQTFTEHRGHPRLRMRHMHFPIDAAARERWLVLMGNALDTVSDEDLPEAPRAAMWEHMVRVADMLVNKL